MSQTHDNAIPFTPLTIHSTELSAACPRAAKLRIDGRASNVTASALYTGALLDAACGYVHQYDEWARADFAMTYAVKWVEARTHAEGRVLSDAVVESQDKIVSNCTTLLLEYMRRFHHRFQQCSLVGVQTPIRWRHMFGPNHFESHLDLVLQDHDGVLGVGPNRLVVIDWKGTLQNPTHDYVVRNAQLMAYYGAVRWGEIMLGDEWVSMDTWPEVGLLHLPSLKPYARATTATNADGSTTKYSKGDTRPDQSILKWARFSPKRWPDMFEELAGKVKMIEQDIWPMRPDPVGCYVCDARDACPRFDWNSDTPQFEV